MAKPAQTATPVAARKRILVAVEDAWLRFRLHREFERTGCQVVSLPRLVPGEPSVAGTYDLVLADLSLLPEGSRLEVLRALRARSPRAQFVLLVSKEEGGVAERARQCGFDLVLERPTSAEAIPDLVEKALGQSQPGVKPVYIPIDFQVLVEGPGGPARRHAGTAFTSLLVHGVILALALFVPLVYTETLDLRELAGTWLVAPPPPPPPPAPPAKVMPRRVRPTLQMLEGKLVAPVVIPKEVAQIVDEDIDIDLGGVIGGVPGGLPGGRLGGVIGGILGGLPSPKALPPQPPKPVRVGGNIRRPHLIRRVEPIYPSVARQARIHGTVRIDAVINTSGRVVEMKVLTGHPLLVKPALDAVKQWVYEPTYLNEQPIPVALEITVLFTMR